MKGTKNAGNYKAKARGLGRPRPLVGLRLRGIALSMLLLPFTAAFAQAAEVSEEIAAEPAPSTPNLDELAVQRLSPQVRELPLQISIPTIPLDAIRHFLRGPRLVSSEELDAAPYVLAFSDDHLVGGTGGDIYVQGLEPKSAFTFAVVRRGEIYRDPDNGELLGYEAIPVGAAEVKHYGQPGTVVLSKVSREALVGDRLIADEPEAFSENFFPRAPEGLVNGKIIAVTGGFARIGQYQVVAMNRGSQHGLEPGHVLDILHAGGAATDRAKASRVALPETLSGQLVVFKVSPRLSYGLVMSATQPITKLDKVEKPALGRR